MADQRFAGSPELERFLTRLGPGTLRFGGNTIDRTVWLGDGIGSGGSLPGGAIPVTGGDLRRVLGFAQRTGWRVILALDLGRFDPAGAASEAAFAFRVGGSSLLAVEIGNEPDLYPSRDLRASDWSYAAYRTQFDAYVRAIHALEPRVPIVGPATWGVSNRAWLLPFVRDEASVIALATHHHYPTDVHQLPGSSRAPTIGNLLSATLMARTAATLDTVAQAAAGRGLALRVDETNSASGFGQRDVSDVAAAALWGIDYLYTAAERGAAGINFQGTWSCRGPSSVYTPICGAEGAYDARPLLYAMLFFHTAAVGRVLPVTITAPAAGANVSAHATLDDAGALRLAIINKDVRRPAEARLPASVTAAFGSGDVWRLSGTALTAPAVTLGGAAIDASARWIPAAPQPLCARDGEVRLSVAVAAAALVTLRPATATGSAPGLPACGGASQIADGRSVASSAPGSRSPSTVLARERTGDHAVTRP